MAASNRWKKLLKQLGFVRKSNGYPRAFLRFEQLDSRTVLAGDAFADLENTHLLAQSDTTTQGTNAYSWVSVPASDFALAEGEGNSSGSTGGSSGSTGGTSGSTGGTSGSTGGTSGSTGGTSGSTGGTSGSTGGTSGSTGGTGGSTGGTSGSTGGTSGSTSGTSGSTGGTSGSTGGTSGSTGGTSGSTGGTSGSTGGTGGSTGGTSGSTGGTSGSTGGTSGSTGGTSGSTGGTSGSTGGTSGSTGGTGGSTGGTVGGFTIGPAVGAEGGVVQFPVTFNGNAPGGATAYLNSDAFPLGTSPGISATAGYDFLPSTISLQFSGNDGETQYYVVSLGEDDFVEDSEYFRATITGTYSPSGTVTGAGSTETGTITDSDTATLSFVVSSNNPEGNPTAAGTATITATLSHPIQKLFQVPYSFADSDATAAKDYVDAPGTMMLPFSSHGAVPKLTTTLAVNFKADSIVEGMEAFKVIFAGVGPRVVVNQNPNYVFITDDDVAFVQIVAVSPVTEGGTVNVQVMFVGNSDVGGATVDFYTTAGTASRSAGDYEAASATSVTLAGEHGATETVTIQTNDDNTVEAAIETFFANISGLQADVAAGGRITIRNSPQLINISDNDSAVLSISDASPVWEEWWGTTPQDVEFELTLSNPVDVAVTVNYTLGTNGDPSFIFGTDVVPAAGAYTFVIPANSTSAKIKVRTVADTTPEGTETFRAIVTGWTTTGTRNVSLGSTIAVGTIYSNE